MYHCPDGGHLQLVEKLLQSWTPECTVGTMLLNNENWNARSALFNALYQWAVWSRLSETALIKERPCHCPITLSRYVWLCFQILYKKDWICYWSFYCKYCCNLINLSNKNNSYNLKRMSIDVDSHYWYLRKQIFLASNREILKPKKNGKRSR